MRFSVFFMLLLLSCSSVFSQHSVARDWNEEMLHAIRNDFARPTVHARNLFHGAIAMYDAWAIFNDTATPVLLGNTFQGFSVAYDPLPMPSNPDEATHEVMSYALYRLMQHRFKDSP